MIITNAKFIVESETNGEEMIKFIERAGRTCYKSEESITETSARQFVKKIIANGHEAMIEHATMSVRVICDRGVSHEWVRHRLFSFAQESTRYCDYSNKKYDKQITFISPCFWSEDSILYRIWKEAMEYAEIKYMELIENGATPQEARTVLNNSLKTEIVITGNLREWRNFFKLRTVRGVHPQMLEIAIPLLLQFSQKIPVVFDDLVGRMDYGLFDKYSYHA